MPLLLLILAILIEATCQCYLFLCLNRNKLKSWYSLIPNWFKEDCHSLVIPNGALLDYHSTSIAMLKTISSIQLHATVSFDSWGISIETTIVKDTCSYPVIEINWWYGILLLQIALKWHITHQWYPIEQASSIFHATVTFDFSHFNRSNMSMIPVSMLK